MTSIRLPFEIDAGLGRVHTETERTKYIRQLMQQVLLTSPGERIDRPDYGCGVRRMVFAPNNPATATLTQVLVYQALTEWLADVIIVDRIEVHPDVATLSIEITYRDIETGSTDVLNQEFR
jgi:phage baseplate assembly protein W